MSLQRVGQRAMILSGMNAAEVGEIIGGYRDAGKTPPVASPVGMQHLSSVIAQIFIYSVRHAPPSVLLMQDCSHH